MHTVVVTHSHPDHFGGAGWVRKETGADMVWVPATGFPTASAMGASWDRDLVRRVAVADMRAIDEFGVGVLIRRVIERVKARNGVLHLSFDVDFLDPAVAPGVGTTVPGGATYREAHLVMELLHDSGLVRSVDIVELNPFLDERGRTARVAVELIGSLFGLQITDRPTPTNAIFPDK